MLQGLTSKASLVRAKASTVQVARGKRQASCQATAKKATTSGQQVGAPVFEGGDSAVRFNYPGISQFRLPFKPKL